MRRRRLLLPASVLALSVLAASVLSALPSLPTPRAEAGESADLAAVRRLLEDPSPSVRASALRRLAGAEAPAAWRVLLERLDDPHPYPRRAAAGVLGALLDPAARRFVAAEAPRLRPEVARAEACRTFAAWADEEGWAALRRLAGDREPTVRAEAVRWLAEDPTEAGGAVLRAALADPDGLVRAEALDAVAGATGGALGTAPRAAPRAAPGGTLPASLLSDPDPRVRFSALAGSVAQEEETAVVAVLHGLDDAVWSVRLLAAESAGRVRDRRVLRPLLRALEDERRRVARAAHASLVLLTGVPFDPVPETWRAWLEGDGRDFDPALTVPLEPSGPRPPPDPGGTTVAVSRFLGLSIESRHVGFVIDASGSMAEPVGEGRTRWGVVCRELEQALGGLDGGQANVFCFADGVQAVFPRSGPVNAARRAEVSRWLARRAPGGRTALYDGIVAGLADPALDTLVVLSDGAPSAGAFFTKTDLLSEVRRANRWRHARIDVVAVGSDGIAERWRDVLETIARETGGVCVRR